MISKKTYIPAKPRNKKLANVSVGAVIGKSDFRQVAGSSHEHVNKAVLDQITPEILNWWKLDEDGNLYTDYNLYSTKGVSAYGPGVGGGGGAGGSLADLLDVQLTDLNAISLLQYNGSHWVNIPASEVGTPVSWGVASGGYIPLSVNGAQNVMAMLGHTHAITEITGLQASLDRMVTLDIAQTITGAKTFTGAVNINGTMTKSSTALVTNLNADLLDGYHFEDFSARTIYHATDGILVRTTMSATSATTAFGRITGNGYDPSNSPIDTTFQFYSYSTNDSFIYQKALNNGYPINYIKLFVYEGYVCLWIPFRGNFQSYSFEVWRLIDGVRVNGISSVENSPMPTDGVTRLVTITPAQSALITDNVASATKLQTARTIWGQSFDGTANVSGALTGVGTIYGVNQNLIIANASESNRGWLVLDGIDNTLRASSLQAGVMNLGISAIRWGTLYAVNGDFTSSVKASTLIASNLSANYIPRHTATGLVNSQIYDNGTNVGIGVNNPTQKLSLPHSTRIGFSFSDSNELIYNYITKPAAGNSPLTFAATYAPPSTGIIFNFVRNSDISLMSIKQKGSVCIGPAVNNPGARLSFGPYYILNSALTPDTITSHIRLYEDDGGATHYGIGVSQSALNLAAQEATGTIRFHTNYAERVRIDSSGNVGIGIEPAYKLDVSGTGNFTTSARSPKIDLANGWTLNAVGAELQVQQNGVVKGVFNSGGFYSTGGLSAYGPGVDNPSAIGALSDLMDVSLTAPASTNLLQFNGTHWVNVPASAVGTPVSWGTTSSGYSPVTIGTESRTVALLGHTHGEYLTEITKAQVEAVLTGNITSHTHGYLPLTGGAMNNTNLVTNLNADLLDGLHKTAFAQQFHAALGTNTGWYKIRILPATSWMIAFNVRIYQSYQFNEIMFSGYNYGTNYWHQPQARLVTSTSTNIQVHFGYDSAWNLWVAVPAGMYTGLSIVPVTNGHTQGGDWSNNFSITAEATLTGTIQSTQNLQRPLYRDENAGSASVLQTARTIALSGAATGTPTGFNGSQNITIPVTSLSASNLTGTVPSAVLGNSSLYIGTTLVPLNRASGLLNLTGIGSLSMSAALSGATTIAASQGMSAPKMDFGNGWTAEASGAELHFKLNGVLQVKIVNGTLVSTGGITAYA